MGCGKGESRWTITGLVDPPLHNVSFIQGLEIIRMGAVSHVKGEVTFSRLSKMVET